MQAVVACGFPSVRDVWALDSNGQNMFLHALNLAIIFMLVAATSLGGPLDAGIRSTCDSAGQSVRSMGYEFDVAAHCCWLALRRCAAADV